MAKAKSGKTDEKGEKGETDTATRSARIGRLRSGLALCVLLAWGALAVWATLDLDRRTESAARAQAESLASVVRVANLLFQTEEGEIDGALERLRLDFRAQGAWNPKQPPDPIEGRPEPASVPIDERRLGGLMHRSVADSELLAALDLVIAGHDGLSARRVERDGNKTRTREWSPKEREANAKALWYAEEVRRAVVSGGRRVERGELSFEGEIPRPLLRIAIGLHEASDVVQAVLVGSVDLTRLAGRMAALAPPQGRVTLANTEGRPLDPTRAVGLDPARLSDLTARATASETPVDPFEADGYRVFGTPLAHRDGSLSELVLLAEVPASATGLAAWVASPWPVSLAVSALVSALALVVLFRSNALFGASEQAARENGARIGRSTDAASAADEAPGAETEIIALRDWLADIRGCLERDAAARGLSLALRCERSLPNRVASDGTWLGGLVLAMGREALDASIADRVVLEVFEDAGETLRFEIDAGGASLSPVAGMERAAARLGARLESLPEGRLALVLPTAFP